MSSYLTIDDLDKEKVIAELYDSAQCLEEFCAHMSCDHCILYSACCHIDNYLGCVDPLYHLMHAIKRCVKSYEKNGERLA